MIEVATEDRDYLRFLWWEDDDTKKMKVYRHSRVVFGTTCSPFILGAVLEHHLSNAHDKYNLTARKLMQSMYVDNCVTSVTSKEEYDIFRTESIGLLNDAKMELRSWESTIEEESPKEKNENEDRYITKVLGLQWNKRLDTLNVDFNTEFLSLPEVLTKRILLSLIQKIFDAVGFLTPAILPFKLLLQKAWRIETESRSDQKKVKLNWDSPLPESIAHEFRKRYQGINCLREVEILRLITDDVVKKSQWTLHTFVDASQATYAAVVFFLRVENNTRVSVQLLLAKARVAPLKSITIPRLELLTCLVGSRLSSTVKSALHLENVKEYFWSDSSTALAWIRRDEQLATFVGNRVKEIRSLTHPEDWKHIPGIHNPADLILRGCYPTQLKESEWWEGPKWLKGPEEEWPIHQSEDNEDEIAILAERTKKLDHTVTMLTLDMTRNLSFSQRRGERGSGLRVKGPVQDFYALREKCLANHTLFEDPEFRAENSSIFFNETSTRPFKWRRPKEISTNPQLFVEVASRFDILKGEVGNYWLLDAMANIGLHKTLFHQVVPTDQGFEYNYAGIFHFRIWQNGHWVDVVIDDRLPTVYGKLVFLLPTVQREFWTALLEKAYAKLHGSYEALQGGTTCEAMEDFTGGITEVYDLNNAPPPMFQIMLKAYEHASLMACSIEPDRNVLEDETPEGLVIGHAYNITMVKYVDIQTPRRIINIPLVRLRSPWRNKPEWNGPWSEESREWKVIPDHIKEKLGLTFDLQGEFWMAFKDFKNIFSHIEIYNLNPNYVEEEMLGHDKKRWEMSVFEGEWVKGVTAGGCRNFLETFCHNPQYRIDPDEDNDDDDNRCSVVVALMQKNRRPRRKMGTGILNIGFIMYHLSEPDRLPKPLGRDFFMNHRSVAHSPSFINLREVSCRFKLPPGVYCIIPSTFKPNEEGEFILRVLSENKNNLKENDDELGIREIDSKYLVQSKHEERRREDNAKEIFLRIAGENSEIGWLELKKLLDHSLKNGEQRNFSKDSCRSLVAVMDIDRSGELCYEEFKVLWKEILDWETVFKMFDKNGSGFLSAYEMRQALNFAGCRMNNHILSVLVHRYGTRDGRISFEDFIVFSVKLKATIDIFKQKDPDDTNWATFTMEEWIEKTVYA